MPEAFLDASFHVPWSRLTSGQVEPSIDRALREAEAAIDRIAAQPPDGLTFENTFLALEAATEPLSLAWNKVHHLDAVRNSPDLREAMNRMLPRVTAFQAQIPLHEPLWKALKSCADSPEAASLPPVPRRFVEETLREFIQSGADLPPDRKERLRTLEAELAEKTQKYSENVLDATNAWDLVVEDPARLAGLPSAAVEAAREAALAKGLGTPDAPRWRFTLKAPSYLPVLQHADDALLRREIWTAVSRIGRDAPYDNTPLIRDILALRQEKAELLGKPHFADLILEPRMAKSGAGALAFIEDLHARIAVRFQREIAELERFRAEQTGEPAGRLEPWDLSYWSEKLRQQRYAFSDEDLRPYFSIQQVIAGLFNICQAIFGIRIEERPTVCRSEPPPSLPSQETEVEVWHPDVRFYDIHDEDGAHLGSFYADWHPRESKRAGAWMNSLRTGLPAGASPSGRREPHLGLMCGNLTPPAEGRPALLDHREVETVFHEFGHLLHHLLGDVPIKSLNGIHVVWDFVELPSQIMENFCWERVSLDRFARHHQTGDPIPEDLYEKMRRARNFQAALFTMRQLNFGRMDLELHMHFPAFRDQDLDAALGRLLEGYTVPTRTARPPNTHSFLHLFSSSTGYAAGYYSYKWAEVLDADAFSRFQQEGVLSRTAGGAFRDCILSRGNSKEPGELFREFMGRDPSLDPLLVRNGLCEPAVTPS